MRMETARKTRMKRLQSGWQKVFVKLVQACLLEKETMPFSMRFKTIKEVNIKECKEGLSQEQVWKEEIWDVELPTEE
jgi:hypothetical protein